MGKYAANSTVLTNPLETSEVGGAIVFWEQIQNGAGVTAAQLVANKSALDLTDVIHVSNSGDDSHSGRSANAAVSGWAQAVKLATAGAGLPKAIVIPDGSLLAVSTPPVPLIVVGTKGARLTGSFEPKGVWHVTYLGSQTVRGGSPDIVTLPVNSFVTADDITASVALTQSGTHDTTKLICPRIQGTLTLAGTGHVYVAVDVVTGAVAVDETKLSVHGFIERTPYGWDFSSSDVSYRQLVAQSISVQDLTVSGDLKNPALASRIDVIAQRNAGGIAHLGVPAGDRLDARTPVVVADTPAGGRIFPARNNRGVDVFERADIYSRSEIDGTQVVTAAEADVFIGDSTEKSAFDYAEGDQLGLLAWHDVSNNHLWARAMAVPAGTNLAVKEGVKNSEGNSFAPQYTTITPTTVDSGKLFSVSIAWKSAWEFGLWTVENKDLYVRECTVAVDSGVITFGSPRQISATAAVAVRAVYSPRHDMTFVFVAADLGDHQILALDILPTNVVIRSTETLLDRDPHGDEDDADCMGLGLMGDQLVTIRADSDLAYWWSAVFPIRADGSLGPLAGDSKNLFWHPESGPDTAIATDWAATTDGSRIYIAGLTDEGNNRIIAISYILHGTGAVQEHNSGNLSRETGGTPTRDWGRSRIAYSPRFHMIEVFMLWAPSTDPGSVWKTQLAAPVTQTFHTGVIGVARSDTDPGIVPDVALPGDLVDRLSGLTPGVLYYVDDHGAVSAQPSDAAVYFAVTETAAIVANDAQTDRIHGNEAAVNEIAARLSHVAEFDPHITAGESVRALQPIAVGESGAGGTFGFEAVDTSAPANQLGVKEVYTTAEAAADSDLINRWTDKNFVNQTDVQAAGLGINARWAMVAHQRTNRRLVVRVAPVSAIADKTDGYEAADFTVVDSVQTADDIDRIEVVWTGDDTAVLVYISLGILRLRHVGVSASGSTIGNELSTLSTKCEDVRACATTAYGTFPRLFIVVRRTANTAKIWQYLARTILSDGTIAPAGGSQFQQVSTAHDLDWGNDGLGVVSHAHGVQVYLPTKKGLTLGVRQVTVPLRLGAITSSTMTISSIVDFVQDMAKWSVGGVGDARLFLGYRLRNTSLIGIGTLNAQLRRITDTSLTGDIFNLADVLGQEKTLGYTGIGSVEAPSMAVNPETNSIEWIQLASNTVVKSQADVALVAVDHRDLVGLSLAAARGGDAIVLATYGETVRGLAALTPKTQYRVRSDGSVAASTGSGDADPKIYKALSKTVAVLNYDL